jgi:hypothetical protein
MPATDQGPDRLVCVGQYLRRHAPDWVSWQFVPYGFHQRGFLPSALLQHAPGLRGPRCHVMVHEPWLGIETGAAWRARATGWLQRRGVVCLLNQLDPDCVQTTNAAYQHVLRREGFEASVLGLFGNVPIADPLPRDEVLARWLPSSNTSDGAAPLVAITFGTLHPQWHPGATVDWLLTTARRLARPPVLISIGRTGHHAETILDAFRKVGIPVVVTGELNATAISPLLVAADLGIAPHPWALIGKSGAAAAMLDHGLPVLVPREDWHLRGRITSTLPDVTCDPLLARLAGLDAIRTDRWLAQRNAPMAALPQIAAAMLGSIERASSLS